jgi:hypothetical protein
MLNKMLSMFAAMATGLLIMGIVWAGSDNDTALAHGECGPADSPVTDSGDTVVGGGEIGIDADANLSDDSADVSVDATITEDNSTTSTTVKDDSDDDSSTTTTTPAPTTTAPPATPTTSDAHDGYEDSHFLLDIDGDVEVFSVEDAGNVEVKSVLGQLILVDVNVNAGWSYKVKKGLFDKLEVVFYKTGIHIDVDVELNRHSLIVDIDAEIS